MIEEDYSEAEKGFENALALNSHNEHIKSWYAELLYMIKKYDAAKQLFSELYNNGKQNDNKVNTGLFRCFFALENEPMAYKIISEYIKSNSRDSIFKRDAQKAYFDEITKLFGEKEKPESVAQLKKMIEYAEKADHILSNGRSQEKLELLHSIKIKDGDFFETSTDNQTNLLQKALRFILGKDLFEFFKN